MTTSKATALTRTQLEALTATNIEDTIPEAELAAALASRPFIQAGLLNLRDLGAVPGSAVRPGLIYRSAKLQDDASTHAWIGEQVKTVFDLRGEAEVRHSPDPAVDGVANIWFAPERKPDHIDLTRFIDGDGSAEWARQYLAVLELYRPGIRAVLEHIRDRPGQSLLFHCTAGRDRTGIVAGLLHDLAGTAHKDVVYDYMLTRVGLEPGRAQLEARILAHWKIADAQNEPGWSNFASLRPTSWCAFVDGVQETYGGFEGYVTRHLGFSEEDVGTIRRHLRDTTSVV
ncbi:hypothetical protein CspeluHIS016_0402860 [Cutaneotrichosporon spelunceum]|uniref:Tyrosine specific protein phosphatases domain-containing protein n=1 Tax=Cutaneotrichosporon spelunceum TaxID=1672016 RepID=A0AAD3TV21_9TREE|nr:hypothetical protein CspeluHIS016_0402860 [Cutaneotrichosporon spelunceum]